jgi:branched-chain amino acid transport system permease protein
MKKKTAGSGPKRLSYQRLIDQIYIFLDDLGKNCFDVWDDFHSWILKIVAPVFGTTASALSMSLSSLLRIQKRGILYWPFILLRVIIGVSLVCIVLVPLTALILIAGTLAGIFGFRNVGEYKLMEQVAAWLFLAIVFLALPYFCSEYTTYKLSLAAAFSVGIIGLDFLFGQCGIISLGQGGFLLASGYVTTWLCNGKLGFNIPLLPSVFLGALLNGFWGMLLGIPALRVKDHYLVVVTLTFSLMIPVIMKSDYLLPLSGLREGGLFISDITPPSILSMIPAHIWKYYAVVGPCILLACFAYNLVHHSQVGRAFRIIRCDNEISMIMGIPVIRFKLFAFALSAIYAGFAGGLLTVLVRYISPDAYSVQTSIDFLAANIIGGPGSILGSILGGAFLSFEPDFTHRLSELIPGGKALARGTYGLVVVLIVLFAPRGIAGELSAFLKRKFQRSARRGTFQFSPPPDYDYLEERREFFRPKEGPDVGV